MGKNKLQKTLTESLSQIDGAMAALDAYPDLEDALLSKAQGLANKYLGKLFPTQLDFAKEVLEHLVGTDALIEIVSDFLTVALPEVEIGLKAALLANMNNLGSECTIDPIIYEKAIKEGIIFDLKQIDLIDKLSVSPLDKKLGQYYYFGIENCESAYDVLQSAISPDENTEANNSSENTKTNADVNKSYNGTTSTKSTEKKKRDFDCLLWYMKNKAAYREVWGKRTNASEDIFNCGEEGTTIINYLTEKGKKNTVYYNINGENLISYSCESKKWKEETHENSVEYVDTTKEYRYYDGSTLYSWKYGAPSITKISRKKYYLTDKINNTYYCWDSTSKKWVSKTASDTVYVSTDKIPTDSDIKKNTTFYIGKVLNIVTKDATSKKNPDGSTYLKGLSLTEAIDVTNDVENKNCLFVDYGDGDNSKNVKNKEYEKLIVAFGNEYKDVQKTWNKEKVKLNDGEEAKENVVAMKLYYEDKDFVEGGTHTFDKNVDKILITPHTIVYNVDAKNNIIGGNSTPFVNVDNKDNKYTKDFGVVTLEYSPRTGNVKQSDGDPLQQQTPYDNVLHVFIGNVKEFPDSKRNKIESNLKESSNSNKAAVELYNKFNSVLSSHLSLWKAYVKEQQRVNIENKKKGKEEQDIQKLELNQQYKAAYSALQEMIVGGGQIYQSHLTAEHNCFNDVTALSNKITKLTELFNRYFKQKEVTVYDEDGTPHNKPINEWTYKDDVFNFDEFKNLSFEITGTDYLGYKDKYYSIASFAWRAAQIMESNENLLYLSAKNLKYPDASQDYYLKRTLFEFNTDYINSLQLFDSKVLAAQIITSLFGGLTLSAMLGATASWKTEYIRDTVKDMVEKSIAAQDYSVSDCFFTFTNDSYNGMLKATELRQAGLYSKHGEENGNSTINPIDLLEGLNQLDSAADQVERTSIIKGALLKVSEEVSKDTYTESNSLSINSDFNVQVSFVETLITNLCTQLVMAMLSPKVYLLILINLHMFGLTTNFNVKSFIQNFFNLIMSMVNSCVEKFMEHLSEEIMGYVEDLVSKLAEKLVMEQTEMYMRLLKQIFEHFRALTKCSNGEGWTQDVVGSADIIESDVTETTNEC
jgi:hypothetical protein